MASRGPNQLDQTLARRGDRQFGVASHDQLVADGVHAQAIFEASDKLRLRPLWRSIYAIGHTALRREGWWYAALLACGEGAVLGDRSAAQFWRLESGPMFPIATFASGDRGRKLSRIDARRTKLVPGETTTVDGIRVTTPARTLIDLCAHRTPQRRRELVERAQDTKSFDAEQVRAGLEAHPRQPGRRALLDFLDLLKPKEDGTRSHLERLFLPLTSRAALPRPLINHKILGRRRDFVWPDLRLVIEVDGYAYHSSRQAIRRDKARDRELLAAHWRPARFMYEEVAFEPDYVVRELRRLVGA